MIRLSPKQDSVDIEKPRVFSDKDVTLLADFLTAVVDDDVETVDRCLRENMPYTLPNLLLMSLKEIKATYLENFVSDVLDKIKNSDLTCRQSDPVMNKIRNNSGVISLCVRNLSARCLSYFAERQLYFDAEPEAIRLLNILNDIPESGKTFKSKLRVVGKITCKIYNVDPNSYIRARDYLLTDSHFEACLSYGFGGPNRGFPSYPLYRFYIPLFMLYAIKGKRRDELLNLFVDLGANLDLKVIYKSNLTNRENPFDNYGLREVSALCFKQSIVRAYLNAGKGFTEEEAQNLLEIIVKGHSNKFNFTSPKESAPDEDIINTIGMLCDSLTTQEVKSQIFQLFYNRCFCNENGRYQSWSFSEPQLYALIRIMRGLDSVKFREKFALNLIAGAEITLFLADGNYRVPLFILEHGVSDGVNHRDGDSETVGHRVINELMNSSLDRRNGPWKALREESLEYLAFLSEIGLDFSVKNKKGYTVCDLCYSSKRSVSIHSPSDSSQVEQKRFLPHGKAIHNELSQIIARQEQWGVPSEQIEFVHEW